ncbi:MAG: spondin domain-containing protein [Thiotrichales bacterium]
MKALIFSAALLALAGCSNDNNSSNSSTESDTEGTVTPTSYRVSLINLTNGQPFSPPAAILHGNDFKAWSIGASASAAVEMLAESGNGSALISASNSSATFSGAAVLLPGASLSFDITSDENQTALTLATMLVNTNDAFTGVNSLDLSGMQAGEERALLVPAFDAGTEMNDELQAHIPGPAGGGEGFNQARDDVTSVVTYHGGIVGKDDGLNASALSEAERFDNPVMKVVITKM